MFKVIDKTTGEAFTVYGLNGTHFLIYNAKLDWWYYKPIDECRPVAGDPSTGVIMKMNIAGVTDNGKR